MHAGLQDENDHGGSIRGFLNYRRDHEGPIARGVRGDKEERDLPGQRDARETVKESRVSDGRRVFPAD